MNNKISIILPTYNRGEVLPRAIESVIKQTFQNWELYVVDDGSTDNTKNLIQEKYSNYSRINFIERPDSKPKGANACRNIGIEQAGGKYVALLDSDDEWKEQHLENCVKLSQNKPKFHGCYSNIIRKKKYNDRIYNSRPIKEDETYIDFLLGGKFRAQTSSYFLLRNAALDVMFDESLQRHQDWDFFIRFGKRFKWRFNDSANVIVHSNDRGIFTREHFKSFIQFYKKYEKDISDPKIRHEYLYSYYKKALKAFDTKAVKFYEAELRKREFRAGFALNYPTLYKGYKYLARKLGLGQIKLFLKAVLKNN